MSNFATLTGTVLDINSNPVPNAIITVALWNYGNNTPTAPGGIIVTPVITTLADISGNFTTQVYGVDVITPLGTVYTVTYANQNRITVSTASYFFFSNISYNLNTFAPNVTYPIPEVVGPVNATQIQGRNITTAIPADGNTLKWVAANNDWEYGVGGGGNVTSVFGRTGVVTAANTDYDGVDDLLLGDTGTQSIAIHTASQMIQVSANKEIDLTANASLQLGDNAGDPVFSLNGNLAQVFTDATGNLLTLTGTSVTAPTPLTADNSTKVATTAWVRNQSYLSGIVGLNHGGTNVDLSATGGAHKVLMQTSSGANITVAQLAASDISGLAASATTDTTNAANISSGTLPAGRLPNPSASTLGGIESYAAVSHQWLNQISTSGVPSSTQPAFSDISGLVTPTQEQLVDVASGTGITYKRSATAHNTGNSPRTNVTIAVNPGETVVVVVNSGTNGANSADYVVSDDGANHYTYALAVNSNSGTTYVYVGLNVRKTVTTINVDLMSAGLTTTVVAGVYGGVGSIGANTTANALTVSLTTTANNSFVVAGITYFQTAVTITQSGVTTGNGRANIASTTSPANTVGISLVDNTAVSSGTSVTCAVTTNGAPTNATVAVELIPY